MYILLHKRQYIKLVSVHERCCVSVCLVCVCAEYSTCLLRSLGHTLHWWLLHVRARLLSVLIVCGVVWSAGRGVPGSLGKSKGEARSREKTSARDVAMARANARAGARTRIRPSAIAIEMARIVNTYNYRVYRIRL